MKVSMCFYQTVKEKKELADIAENEGVSQTQIIRSALSLYINCNKKPNPCPACGSVKEKEE